MILEKVLQWLTSLQRWTESEIVALAFLNSSQINITSQNVDEVVENLTAIVVSADEVEDQVTENVEIIDDILTRAADVIQTHRKDTSLDDVYAVSITYKSINMFILPIIIIINIMCFIFRLQDPPSQSVTEFRGGQRMLDAHREIGQCL